MDRGAGGWISGFQADASWTPYQHPQQTNEGMACFLSTLLVTIEMVSTAMHGLWHIAKSS